MKAKSLQLTIFRYGLFLSVTILAFLFAPNAYAQVETDFELAEGYSYGELKGQEGWYSTGNYASTTINFSTSYVGYYSVKWDYLTMDLFLPGYHVMKHYFATSTASASTTQCMFIYVENDIGAGSTDNFITIESSANSSYVCGAFKMSAHSLYGLYNNSSYQLLGTLTPDDWHELCMTWKDTSNRVTYSVDGAINTYTNSNCATPDRISYDLGDDFDDNSTRLYLDTLTTATGTAESPGVYDTENAELVWFFPQDGYEISTSTFNDWGLYYRMNAADIGPLNLLWVTYKTPDGDIVRDGGIVTGTENLTYDVIEATDTQQPGEYYAQAFLYQVTTNDICTDATADFNNRQFKCDSSLLAATETIYFTVTSDGKSIFQYGTIRGPIMATSTSNEESVLFDAAWTFVKRIFPFSLASQIKTIFDLTNKEDVTKASITIGDLVSDEYNGGYGDAVLLDENTISDALPIWDEYIYSTIEFFIQIATILITIWMIFPSIATRDD